MRGFLLVLLMSFAYVRRITSCPASCVVCSEEAIICHKLSNIIGVPETTKVLMLTDGQIDSVGSRNLSDLSNMTLLGLSNNAIANITESAFQSLTVLKVLLLDHNRITSSSIFRSTFSQLQSLEILQLGNNAIQVIDGAWFRHMRILLTLQLEGNFITRLDSVTFRSANLENLETLDLSDNLIEYIARGSFRALPRLHRLDLSGNSLRTAPDAFSYLSWLSALNLDHNQWNCTCELQELSSFLSSYMQAPDKVLYNGRQLVCLSTANPAVQTVLQLTEANCVPPNENITVVIASKGSISARQYARDVTLAAIFFFVGGVGLTVGVLYIFYTKLELKKAFSTWRDRNWDDEGDAHFDGTVQNQGVPQWTLTGDNKTQVLSITHPGQETKLMSANNTVLLNQRPWLRDRVPSGVGLAIPKHHFVCHHCSPDLGSQSQYQRRQGPLSKREDVLCHHVDFTGEKQPPSHIHHSSPSHRKAPIPYSATNGQVQPSRTHRELEGSYSHHNGHAQTIHNLPDYLTIHCARCLKTHEYRQARSTGKTVEMETSNEETLETIHKWEALSETNPNTRSHTERGLNDTKSHRGVGSHLRQPHVWNPGMNIPQQRTVTFNLTGSDAHMISVPKKKSLKVNGHRMKSSDVPKLKEKHRLSMEKASKSNKHEKGDHLKRHKQRVQSSSLLKVKLNLNPFRKNRVHPKEHLNQEEAQSKLERAGTVAKKSKLISKDRKFSSDSHAVSETKRNKGIKVSKTDNNDRAKKLNQTKSTKQSHVLSNQKAKSSRLKIDRLKHTENKLRDLDTVDQEITEPHTPLRKHTKKGRKKDFSAEDDAREHVKSQEKNMPSLSKSSKRTKNSLKTDRDSQESSEESEGKRQPKTVNGICETSVKDDSIDEARTQELKDEELSGSCGLPVSQKMSPKEVSNNDQPANLEVKEREEPPLLQGGTSLGTEKINHTDKTEESLRDTLNSSVLQSQVNFPNTSPTQEAQCTRMLDLGDALVEQKSNQELESKFIGALTIEGEPKKETTFPLGSIQGDYSEVPGISPHTNAGPASSQSHSTEPPPGSLVDSLSASNSGLVPGISDQTTAGGPGRIDSLDEENLSNNNSMKPDSSQPIILQEYLPPSDGSPKRKLRLIIPERPRSRPVTPLDKKIR